MGNTVADGTNEISRSTTFAVLLKYLSNFWRSLEIPLINCKVELKLNCMNRCILPANGADIVNANSISIIFTIKDTKLYATLSAKENQKLSKLLRILKISALE